MTELHTILEAARWAPSAFNVQPWRFVFARRGSPEWDRLFPVLLPFNQDWARNAAALVFRFSKRTSTTPDGEQKHNPSHSFDTGAAWAQMALQATLLGWHSHGMLGFDQQALHALLGVSDDFQSEIVMAIGRLGDKSILSDKVASRGATSDRLPFDAVAQEGKFSFV